jgi:phage baseplate assembly protein gpV
MSTGSNSTASVKSPSWKIQKGRQGLDAGDAIPTRNRQNAKSPISLIGQETPSGTSSATSQEARFYDNFLRRYSDNSNVTRALMFGAFFFIVMVIVMVVLSFILISNNIDTTQLVRGPQGIPGKCNLTQSNQTFFIAGNTELQGNVSVGGYLIVDDELTIFYDSSTGCIDFDSPDFPLCFDNCLNAGCIGSNVSGGNVTVYSPTVFEDPVYVYGPLFVNQTLDIGGASIYWNGTDLVFGGNVSFPNGLAIPIPIGSAGYLTQNGTCMVIDATSCLQVVGGNVSFFTDVLGPFEVIGNSTFDGSVFVYNSSYGLYVTPGGGLVVFSLDGLNLTSATLIELQAPAIDVNGNLTVDGFVTSTLNTVSDVKFTCYPGPAIGDVGFSSGCGCLNVSSTTGICLTSSQNVTVKAANFVFQNTNVSFAGSSTIVSPLTIDNNLIVNDNLNVGGTFTAGNMMFTNITVSGTSNFYGPIFSNSSSVNFSFLNVSSLTTNVFVSQNLSSFFGTGAVVGGSSTLSINGNLTINGGPASVKCAGPVFFPNTLSTPTASPCVPECTDHFRCTDTYNTLSVLTNFTVGAFNSSYVGGVSFGTLGGLQMNTVSINSYQVAINASVPVKFYGAIDVGGNIMQGASIHPCCTGEQTDANNNLIIVEMSTGSTSIATSESMVIPFNLIQNPSSTLSSAFNIGTFLFTAPASRFYTVTVYFAMDPAQYTSGTFRGVTLRRSFTLPSSGGPKPIRICSQFTNFAAPPAFSQITCTYGGYFAIGDTMQVNAFFDFAGPLTLYGASFPGIFPTTRLEIYAN